MLTHCNYSQPASIKLDNENIGGHLTPLHTVVLNRFIQLVQTIIQKLFSLHN